MISPFSEDFEKIRTSILRVLGVDVGVKLSRRRHDVYASRVFCALARDGDRRPSFECLGAYLYRDHSTITHHVKCHEDSVEIRRGRYMDPEYMQIFNAVQKDIETRGSDPSKNDTLSQLENIRGLLNDVIKDFETTNSTQENDVLQHN